MKKMLMILMMSMLMISLVSALDFDNVMEYNEEQKLVTITNGFGLGDVIGQAQLLSDNIVQVGTGYQQVAEFNLWAYEDYNDAIKQFEYLNLKNKEKVNRDIDIKIKVVTEITVEDFYSVCDYDNVDNNGIPITPCVKTENGTHQELQTTWKKITPADLRKNEFGISTSRTNIRFIIIPQYFFTP